MILPFLAILLIGCGNSTAPESQTRTERRAQEIRLVRIAEPTNGSMFPIGSTFDVSITLVNDSIMPDSIILSVDNKRLGLVEEFEYSLNTKTLGLGNKQIRATAWQDGQRQTASVSVIIKNNTPPKQLRYRVINTFPHDIEAYTQGLFYHNGYLIESTGQKGSSSLRRVELKTGKVLQSVNLDRRYFGEGTTLFNNKIYQITWTSRKGFVYDAETFNLIRTFDYHTQGWGLTTIGDELVMTDGSNKLYYLEPHSFAEIKRVEVFDHQGPVRNLNELEYIKGKIYANVYLTDKIVIIDPDTGVVEAEVDFSGILSDADRHRNIDVFNGIAWDEENDRIFVTGKNWPRLFEVEIF